MFERFDVLFATFVAGYARDVATALAAGLAAPAVALVTAQIALFGMAVMRGETDEPMGQFAWKMVRTMAVLTFAIGGLAYSQWVLPAAAQAQDDLAVLFVRGIPAGTTAFAALDLANDQANDLLKLLWRDASVLRLDLVLASMLFSAGTAAFLCVGLAVTFVARVLMVFALAIGPLFVLSLLFQSTRRFFDSWLSMLLSAAVMSWFVFFALGLSLAVADRVVDTIERSGAFLSGSIDGVNAIEASVTYVALMVALAVVLYQAPRLAAALTAGPAVQSGIALVSRYVSAARSSSRTSVASGAARGGNGYAAGSLARLPSAYSAAHMAGTATRHAYQRIAARGRP